MMSIYCNMSIIEIDFWRFLCKNNGIVYENNIIQVGIKMESRQNLARVGMFYGNKTNQQLTNFTPTVSCPGSLQTQIVLQVWRLVLQVLIDWSFFSFRPNLLIVLWRLALKSNSWSTLNAFRIFTPILYFTWNSSIMELNKIYNWNYHYLWVNSLNQPKWLANNFSLVGNNCHSKKRIFWIKGENNHLFSDPRKNVKRYLVRKIRSTSSRLKQRSDCFFFMIVIS